MINPKKKTVILGDFNISFPDNLLSKKLLAWEFKQLVEYLSHIEGIIIDHVYISNKVDRQLVVLDHHLSITVTMINLHKIYHVGLGLSLKSV